MDFKRVGKRWFTGLSLDARSGRQVVTLDMLREYFHGQMSLAWDGSGVASPVITGDKAKLEGGQQAQ